MTPEKLDLIFPYFVFGYGAIMTFVLHSPLLSGLAENRLPEAMSQQLKAHRGLGLICLVVGALWTLQNLWLS
jgi:hypothetical protein